MNNSIKGELYIVLGDNEPNKELVKHAENSYVYQIKDKLACEVIKGLKEANEQLRKENENLKAQINIQKFDIMFKEQELIRLRCNNINRLLGR